MITIEQVIKGTGATPENAARFLPHIRWVCELYSINNPRRVAGFLAQIGHESGGLSTLQENLNYSVDALISTFGRHRISEADARKFGRTAAQRANQEAIANCLYGGQWGKDNLGNTEPGDGWKFRGRGLKQLTGRHNYTRYGNAMGLDMTERPELLLEPIHATMSAGWFWGVNKLNAVADSGDFTLLTRRINGGTIGLPQRLALYERVLPTLT